MQEKEKASKVAQGEPSAKERFSYSKLSTYLQCPYRFKLKYDDKKYSSASTLALELGTLCHKGLEIAGQYLSEGLPVPVEDILCGIYNGYPDEQILGANDLKQKYFEDWIAPDTKSLLTYEDKLGNYEAYLKRLASDENSAWSVYATEREFSFPMTEKVEFYGFIDRIDSDGMGGYRLIDYKTSKKLFSKSDITTPLQMVVYALAIENEFGVPPSEYEYDFILLDKIQPVVSQGFVARGETKIYKTLEKIEVDRKAQSFDPKPSPLCHWCDYCKTNTRAKESLKFECPYHSLWTPNNKTSAVNRPAPSKGTTEGSEKKEVFWF